MAPPFRQRLSKSWAPPLSRLAPINAIDVYQQWLIFTSTPAPNSCTGPMIINRSLSKSGSHWIVVNVVGLLHKHSFAEDRKNILLRLPQRVAMVSIANFVAKFFK